MNNPDLKFLLKLAELLKRDADERRAKFGPSSPNMDGFYEGISWAAEYMIGNIAALQPKHAPEVK